MTVETKINVPSFSPARAALERDYERWAVSEEGQALRDKIVASPSNTMAIFAAGWRARGTEELKEMIK